MAGPNIVSSSPASGDTGVVLGQTIAIVFDSLINHTTLSAATISVSYPAGVGLITPDSYIAQAPQTQTGIAYIQGTYDAEDANNATTLNFTPSQPLSPNTVYTVFVLGGDAQFTSAMVKDTRYPAPAKANTLTRGRGRGFQDGDAVAKRSRKGGRFRRMERAKVFRIFLPDPSICTCKKAHSEGGNQITHTMFMAVMRHSTAFLAPFFPLIV